MWNYIFFQVLNLLRTKCFLQWPHRTWKNDHLIPHHLTQTHHPSQIHHRLHLDRKMSVTSTCWQNWKGWQVFDCSTVLFFVTLTLHQTSFRIYLWFSGGDNVLEKSSLLVVDAIQPRIKVHHAALMLLSCHLRSPFTKEFFS